MAITPVGTWPVTANHFGYSPYTDSTTILDGETTVQSFALSIRSARTVTGTVTDGSGHGWPLYARVDLMPDEEGPMVSELELIEPSLYLVQSPAALDRFVRAIVTGPAS